MMSEAAKIGPATIALFEAIMNAKPHPEQGFRSCLGILRPGANLRHRTRRGGLPARQRHRRDHLRLDHFDPQDTGSIVPTPTKAPDRPPIRHGNIRGPGYYH